MRDKLGARNLLVAVGMLAASLAWPLAGCSSDGGGIGGSLSRILGQALAPETDGAQTNLVPLADRNVVLLQYDENGDIQRATIGKTDANGNFIAEVEAQAVIAIEIAGETNDGEVTVSGLYNPDQPMIEKDLDPATSVACIAGLSAIGDGSITQEELDETRVQNLEDASLDYIDANPGFDFYDSADVDAAVAAVRAATNDGANPASPDAFS